MEERAILMVDDEPIILMSLRQLVKKHYGARFRYETATDAETAEAIVDELFAEGIKIILVITDWIMPGRHGDALVRSVHAKHPEIKLIILSGQVDGERVRALEREVPLAGFVTKPWSARPFLNLIAESVG